MANAIARRLTAAGVAAFLCAFTGCATIVNGTTEEVSLSSTPDGARATIDGAQTVTTPATVSLSRGDEHTITFHKDGYQDDSERLTSSTSGWIWGNVLVGGIAGAMVDAESGAGKKLSSNALNVTLTPLASADSTASAPAPGAAQAAASRPATSGQTGAVINAAPSPPAPRHKQPAPAVDSQTVIHAAH
jgi:hypothetical protein